MLKECGGNAAKVFVNRQKKWEEIEDEMWKEMEALKRKE